MQNSTCDLEASFQPFVLNNGKKPRGRELENYTRVVANFFGGEKLGVANKKLERHKKIDPTPDYNCTSFIFGVMSTAFIHKYAHNIDVAAVFTQHVEKWIQETSLSSSTVDKARHPSYLRIIGLGPSVLPYIFIELATRPGQWFIALRAITGDEPDKGCRNFNDALVAWMDWGRDKGLTAHGLPSQSRLPSFERRELPSHKSA